MGLGIVFVAAVVLDEHFLALPHRVCNQRGTERKSHLACCCYIVLTSLSMVLNADLQGMDKTRAVTTILFLGVIVSAIRFMPSLLCCARRSLPCGCLGGA